MKSITKDGKTYRMRRGKLVEIPPEWVGKTVHKQTIAKRPSKAIHKLRKEIKLNGCGKGSKDKKLQDVENKEATQDKNGLPEEQMKVVYGVEWIEVEFGQRSEGWALFLDKGRCIKETKQASYDGCGGGGYIGPERPLAYVEIPMVCLDDKLKEPLEKTGKVHTESHWRPKFTGNRVSIS